MKILVTLIGAIILALTSLPVAAQSAKALLKSGEGKDVGSAEFTQTPAGRGNQAGGKGITGGRTRFPCAWRRKMRASVHFGGRSL
ncbi:MAG: hypothetical protein WAL01_17485 [Pseudolabrys sp.]